MFTVYGNDTIITTIHNWFRGGNFNSKDEDRNSCPAVTDTNLIKAMIVENLRYGVREIVDATYIPKTIVHNHLIMMRYVNRYKVWVL